MLEAQVWLEREGFRLDVSLNVSRGVTAVLGPSGSGKTTLLHAIAGLVRPHGGRIVLQGDVLFDAAEGINLPAHRRGMAVIFQDLRLFPHMTVEENLKFGMSRPGPAGPQLQEVIELLELYHLLVRFPAILSGGEARRVALGRGLLSHPRLILFDEPLAGLDHELAGKLLPYLVRVREVFDVPALYVTHAPGEALALADRAVVLREGRVVLEGSPTEVLHDPEVFPLAMAAGVENVFRGRVSSVSGSGSEAGARVECGGLAFHTMGEGLEAGRSVLVAVRSRDVLLSTERLSGLSARNQFEGTVEEVHTLGDRVLLYVRADRRWVVEATPGAVEALGLMAGAAVMLHVKSSAIEVLDREHAFEWCRS